MYRNDNTHPDFVELFVRLGLRDGLAGASRNANILTMTTVTRRRPKESGIRTNLSRIPTLAEMIRDGQASHSKIKRATQEALIEWFAQSERLNIARKNYGLRGDRFRDFARRIGVDRSSAFELVKLHAHRAAIMSRCLDEQSSSSGSRRTLLLSRMADLVAMVRG